jgi:4-hydroxy-tetrahydrodipicolinate synthase
MSNNEKLCLEEFNQIKGLISLLFQEGNPSGIKSALNAIGLCDNNLRLPLTKVSRELELKIKSLVFDINKK